MSEINDRQDEYAKVLKMNSLFVDGSDEGMLDILKKELASMAERSKQSTSSSGSNFKTLKHFVLIGEGLPDDSWLLHPAAADADADAVSDETDHGIRTFKTLRSNILDMMKSCLKAFDTTTPTPYPWPGAAPPRCTAPDHRRARRAGWG